MSWDFYLEADLGGPEPILIDDNLNYTYNVSPMYYDVFGDPGIRKFNGLYGHEAIELLTMGIAMMETNPVKYKEMNPKNGWGDYEGALDILYTLRQWCEKAPNAKIIIE